MSYKDYTTNPFVSKLDPKNQDNSTSSTVPSTSNHGPSGSTSSTKAKNSVEVPMNPFSSKYTPTSTSKPSKPTITFSSPPEEDVTNGRHAQEDDDLELPELSQEAIARSASQTQPTHPDWPLVTSAPTPHSTRAYLTSTPSNPNADLEAQFAPYIADPADRNPPPLPFWQRWKMALLVMLITTVVAGATFAVVYAVGLKFIRGESAEEIFSGEVPEGGHVDGGSGEVRYSSTMTATVSGMAPKTSDLNVHGVAPDPGLGFIGVETFVTVSKSIATPTATASASSLAFSIDLSAATGSAPVSIATAPAFSVGLSIATAPNPVATATATATAMNIIAKPVSSTSTPTPSPVAKKARSPVVFPFLPFSFTSSSSTSIFSISSTTSSTSPHITPRQLVVPIIPVMPSPPTSSKITRTPRPSSKPVLLDEEGYVICVDVGGENEDDEAVFEEEECTEAWEELMADLGY